MNHTHARSRGERRWKHDGVRVVPADQLDPNTAQTPGMDRKAAINFARVGAQKLWAGTVHIHPDAKTGAHHHGPLESVIYVVKGRARMRWGDALEFTAEAGPGDFIYIPPYVPHQEINASRRRDARVRALPQRRRGDRGQPRHRAGREARDGALDRSDPSARLSSHALKLSVLDQSVSLAGSSEDAAIRDTLSLAEHCERLGYCALLAERAPWPADDRRQRARDPDGGDRRAHDDASASAAPASCCRTTARSRSPSSSACSRRSRPAGSISASAARRAATCGRRARSTRTPAMPPRTSRSRCATCTPGRALGRHAGITAHPLGPHAPEIWILGSSDYGAQLAAHFGLPYAFAYFFTDGQGAEQAMALYRRLLPAERAPSASRRRRSASGRSPPTATRKRRTSRCRATAGASIAAAASLGPLQSPDAIAARGFDAAEEQSLAPMRARAFVGSAATVGARIRRLAERASSSTRS